MDLDTFSIKDLKYKTGTKVILLVQNCGRIETRVGIIQEISLKMDPCLMMGYYVYKVGLDGYERWIRERYIIGCLKDFDKSDPYFPDTMVINY